MKGIVTDTDAARLKSASFFLIGCQQLTNMQCLAPGSGIFPECMHFSSFDKHPFSFGSCNPQAENNHRMHSYEATYMMEG